MTGLFRHGSDFPIVYQSSNIQVYTNPATEEVFVEDLRTGVAMRISKAPEGGLKFTSEGRVEPVVVTNTIGWRVSKRFSG